MSPDPFSDRGERNQKIRIRLFLNGDGLGVEAGDCRGKEDGRVSRFERYRQVVDDEFIQRLLGNRPGVQLRGKERQRYSDSEQFHAATMAWIPSLPAPDSGQFLHSGETTRRVGYRWFFPAPNSGGRFLARIDSIRFVILQEILSGLN